MHVGWTRPRGKNERVGVEKVSLFRFSEETLEGLAVVDFLDLLDLLDWFIVKPDDISFETYLPAVVEAVEVAGVFLFLKNDPVNHLEKLDSLPRNYDLQGVLCVLEVPPNVLGKALSE